MELGTVDAIGRMESSGCHRNAGEGRLLDAESDLLVAAETKKDARLVRELD